MVYDSKIIIIYRILNPTVTDIEFGNTCLPIRPSTKGVRTEEKVESEWRVEGFLY